MPLNPNPHYAAALLEQLGGANGELKACMQYFVQHFSCADPAIRDLLLDIATEEISHLEMVGTCITQLMGGPDTDPNSLASMDYEMAAEGFTMANAGTHVTSMVNSTVAKSTVLAGHGPALVDSSGSPFSGNFINSVGDLLANLASDFAAELRARKVYEEFREEPSYGNQKYALMYPDLSLGGPGVQTFGPSPNAPVITGPFSGNVDRDTFSPPGAGNQPPTFLAQGIS